MSQRELTHPTPNRCLLCPPPPIFFYFPPFKHVESPSMRQELWCFPHQGAVNTGLTQHSTVVPGHGSGGSLQDHRVWWRSGGTRSSKGVCWGRRRSQKTGFSTTDSAINHLDLSGESRGQVAPPARSKGNEWRAESWSLPRSVRAGGPSSPERMSLGKMRKSERKTDGGEDAGGRRGTRRDAN